MADETRFERRLDRVVFRAVTPRAAAVLISSVATVITVGAGIIMTLVDHHNFPSIGAGLWWSVQTVTTVGYGDHVPITIPGRLVAALVMLVGVSFLTVITASITSAFVDRSRREQETSDAGLVTTAAQLQEMNGRLERIEAALSARR
jgi:voltage-gated potassium channel